MTQQQTLDPNTLDAVRQMIGLARGGRLVEARSVGRKALPDVDKPELIHALLGRMACESDDFDDGISHLRQALLALPDEISVQCDLAAALIHVGAFADALDVASVARMKADPSLQIARFRGFAAQQLEAFADAVEAYSYVVAAAPDDAGTWNNLGNAQAALGLHDEAIASLRKAVELDPDSPPNRVNLANTMSGAGQMAAALDELKLAIVRFPNDFQLQYTLGQLAADAGDIDLAVASLQRASELDPQNADVLAKLGQQMAAGWDMTGAANAFERAMAIQPQLATPYLGLALVREHENDTDGLNKVLGDARLAKIDPGAASFIEALAHRREKRWAEGLAAAEAANADYDATRRAQLIGEFNDRLNHPAEAFSAFEEMNRLASLTPHGPLQMAEIYRDMVETNQSTMTRDWLASWTPADPKSDGDAASPVFLVGFPRSGTTLLDTMLMGHPSVRVLEEKPPLTHTERSIGAIDRLASLSADDIRNARNQYWDEVDSYIDRAGSSVIVDKSPLYLNKTAVIHRLFPEARYILALRHPMDVVLSCFVTNFRPNAAMSNFLDLRQAAELYDRSMTSFFAAQDLLNFQIYPVVYERMIADRDRELRPLFEWLGLDWRDDAVDHLATAAKRGPITTASYAQVHEPLYTRSAGRWTRYRDQLRPIEPILAPWIERFGYSLDVPEQVPVK